MEKEHFKKKEEITMIMIMRVMMREIRELAAVIFAAEVLVAFIVLVSAVIWGGVESVEAF